MIREWLLQILSIFNSIANVTVYLIQYRSNADPVQQNGKTDLEIKPNSYSSPHQQLHKQEAIYDCFH